MSHPSPIFSNHEMWSNDTFIKLMVEWNSISKSNRSYIEKMECFEVVKFDLLQASRFWLKTFKRATWWRDGLE